MRPVGILGGMGPEATILLMQKVLAAVPAQDDADHIPLIVHQNPAVPSRIARLIEGQGDDPGPVLAGMAQALERAGARALAMPCNTAHAFAPQIRAASGLPFLDMRQATVRQVQARQGVRRLGMLASPALRITGAFDQILAEAGLVPVWPRDEAPVLALIRQVKRGEAGAAAAGQLRHLADDLASGCDHLLVACSELSLLTGSLRAGSWTDSLDCLVDDILSYARGG